MGARPPYSTTRIVRTVRAKPLLKKCSVAPNRHSSSELQAQRLGEIGALIRGPLTLMTSRVRSYPSQLHDAANELPQLRGIAVEVRGACVQRRAAKKPGSILILSEQSAL